MRGGQSEHLDFFRSCGWGGQSGTLNVFFKSVTYWPTLQGGGSEKNHPVLYETVQIYRVSILCARKNAIWGARAEILLTQDIASLDSCAGSFLGLAQKY